MKIKTRYYKVWDSFKKPKLEDVIKIEKDGNVTTNKNVQKKNPR